MQKAFGFLRKSIMSIVEAKTTKSAVNEVDQVVEKKKLKPLRYAIMLAYQGKHYFGMQVQKDAPTIESNLFRAMRIYGIISEEEEKKPNLVFFQRAARTDRAVSAVRQICSITLPKDEKFLTDGPRILNEHLPKDIRVVGICRTTPSFHAQKSCDSRTYSYTLPTFAFAELDQLTNSKYRITPERIAEIDDLLKSFIGTHNFFNYTARREYADQSCNRFIISFKTDKTFTFYDSIRKEDMEFITIYIRGQSFMLHQIRKMIGMIIAIIRGLVHKSDIQKTFESLRVSFVIEFHFLLFPQMDVPKAPGLGLLLERLHYENYDRKYAKTHSSLNDWGPTIENEVLRIRNELIVNEILGTECQTQSMMMWLSSLPSHDFACSSEDIAGESKTKLPDAYKVAGEKLAAKVEKEGAEFVEPQDEIDTKNIFQLKEEDALPVTEEDQSVNPPIIPADEYPEVPEKRQRMH
ncbi:TRNA pseudouridine synthase A, mitochondrial [Aphelenchoides besseyi]|nr:TRNA pseudouridine synthase A, mitochondrial [Aphelenchoides besseyi]